MLDTTGAHNPIETLGREKKKRGRGGGTQSKCNNINNKN